LMLRFLKVSVNIGCFGQSFLWFHAVKLTLLNLFVCMYCRKVRDNSICVILYLAICIILLQKLFRASLVRY
jgi:hypothetical protein